MSLKHFKELYSIAKESGVGPALAYDAVVTGGRNPELKPVIDVVLGFCLPPKQGLTKADNPPFNLDKIDESRYLTRNIFFNYYYFFLIFQLFQYSFYFVLFVQPGIV